MKKAFFFMLAMVLTLFVLVACSTNNDGGSDTATPPQNDESGIVSTTPQPTPTTPDVPAIEVPAPPVVEEPPVTEEPIAEEPPVVEDTTPDIDRRRHFEIRTSSNRHSPSGINMTGRGFGSMDDETKQTLLREIEEDINYAFADQLKGPDGSPIARFAYHSYTAGNTNIGWITLDIPATGESLLVSSADFGNRGFRVQLITGEQGGTRLDGNDLGAWIAERAGM